MIFFLRPWRLRAPGLGIRYKRPHGAADNCSSKEWIMQMDAGRKRKRHGYLVCDATKSRANLCSRHVRCRYGIESIRQPKSLPGQLPLFADVSIEQLGGDEQ